MFDPAEFKPNPFYNDEWTPQPLWPHILSNKELLYTPSKRKLQGQGKISCWSGLVAQNAPLHQLGSLWQNQEFYPTMLSFLHSSPLSVNFLIKPAMFRTARVLLKCKDIKTWFKELNVWVNVGKTSDMWLMGTIWLPLPVWVAEWNLLYLYNSGEI